MYDVRRSQYSSRGPRCIYYYIIVQKAASRIAYNSAFMWAIAATCGEFGPNPKDETIVYYNACEMYTM